MSSHILLWNTECGQFAPFGLVHKELLRHEVLLELLGVHPHPKWSKYVPHFQIPLHQLFSSIAWISSTSLIVRVLRLGHMEVSITMKFEALPTLQPLFWFPSNLCTLVKGFTGCKGSINLIEGVILGGTLRVNSGSVLKGFLTLKLLLNFDS